MARRRPKVRSDRHACARRHHCHYRAHLRAGLDGPDLEAVVEAARVAAAIEAKRRGERHAGDPPALARQRRDGVTELDWLIAVSKACQRLPSVGAVSAQETDRSEPADTKQA